MKESMDSSRSGSRILSRSQCKRSCSRSRNRSTSKLEGVHFFRPDQELDKQSKEQQPKGKENEQRSSNKKGLVDKSQERPLKRQLSKEFFDRLTQFSKFQEKLNQPSDQLPPSINPLTKSLQICSSKYIKNIVKKPNPLKQIDTNVCISSRKVVKNPSKAPNPSETFVTRMSPNMEQAQPIEDPPNYVKKTKKQAYYISRVINAFHNNPGSQQDHLSRNHLLVCLKQLQGSLQIDKPTTIKPIKKLPPTNKNTIVFDLDETLLHCNEKPEMPHDVLLPFIFPTGQHVKMGINIRPYARQCLKQLSQHFQLIVFTASHECYGQVVTDYLDPQKKYINHRYFRDSCQKTTHGYVKDLRVIDRPLNNMLLVDNAAFSYCFQVDNGVPIIPYYDYKDDEQLRHLTEYFKSMKDCRDIKAKHCQNLKTNQYIWFNNPRDLISQLYPEEV